MDPSLQGNLTGPGGPLAQPLPAVGPFLPLAPILRGRGILQVGSPSAGRQDAGGERPAEVRRQPPWGGGRHRVARLLSGEGRLRHQQSQPLPLSPWVLISSLFSQLASLSSLSSPGAAGPSVKGQAFSRPGWLLHPAAKGHAGFRLDAHSDRPEGTDDVRAPCAPAQPLQGYLGSRKG